MARLRSLGRRAVLTYRYRGARSLIARLLTFPLRFTPLRTRLPFGLTSSQLAAQRWYRRHGAPVTIVIPSYRDADLVRALVKSLRSTTSRRRVQIVVADDASGGEHLSALASIRGIEVIEGATNGGFSVNVNRGLRAAAPGRDVVLINSDVVALPGWLASLQRAARTQPLVGVTGPKLLYPDGRIQFAGTVRNLGALEWFDHRYRFLPRDWPPANVAQPALAVTGACMYIRHEALERLGGFDERLPMAYEDIDFCLRTWSSGLRVHYCPTAELYHRESSTRGAELGPRERESQRMFWERWGEFLDRREVRTAAGRLRIVYLGDPTGELHGEFAALRRRGHEVEFLKPSDRDQLVACLAPLEAITVAASPTAAEAVWEASLLRGIPVYALGETEAGFAPDAPTAAGYRHEFHYITSSELARTSLRAIRLDATVVPKDDVAGLERFLEALASPVTSVAASHRTDDGEHTTI